MNLWVYFGSLILLLVVLGILYLVAAWWLWRQLPSIKPGSPDSRDYW